MNINIISDSKFSDLKCNLLGIGIDKSDLPKTLSKCEKLARNEFLQYLVVLKFWDLIKAKHSSEFMDYITKAGIIVTSSGLLVGASHFLGHKSVRIHNMFDLVIRLLTLAERQERTVYLLGSTKNTLQQAERNLKRSFPTLRIVGRYSGKHTQGEEKSIVQAIRKASPGLLLVGNGVRNRELWLLNNKGKLPPGLGIWIEDCFEIFAGKKKRPVKQGIFSILKGTLNIIIQPWRLLELPILIYFIFLLLIAKIKKK